MQTRCAMSSHFVSIDGSKMHYLSAGKGDPILFLHGMPVSGYFWRHVMPIMQDAGHCIAPDFIGMGKSDKPDIVYTLFDHIHYVTKFIEALKLKNITVVMHGWGSAVGFHYASLHPNNIKAMAFYESHLQAVTRWEELSLPIQQVATLLHRPGASYRAVMQQNYFIDKLLPRAAIRPIAETAMQVYRAPFLTPESRRPLWQYLIELPLGKDPTNPISQVMQRYSTWLQKTSIPKLLLYGMPGFMTTMATVKWARSHLSQLDTVALEEVMYMAPETTPERFSHALFQWYQKVGEASCAISG